MSNQENFGSIYALDLRPRPETGGSRVMVGSVITPPTSIAVGSFLTVSPVSLFGPELEGSPGVVTNGSTASVAVYLVGPDLPSQGDLLVCRSVGYRWVADRGGKTSSGIGGIVIPGCPCPGGVAGGTPTSLFMHVQHPELNSQNLRPATLVYGPSPLFYGPLGVVGNNHFSQETYTDISSSDKFQYLFRCESGVFVVRKIYASSVSSGGQPFLSNVLYSWAIGFPGNNCDTASKRFKLTVGSIYAGANTNTVVTVDTNGSS